MAVLVNPTAPKSHSAPKKNPRKIKKINLKINQYPEGYFKNKCNKSELSWSTLSCSSHKQLRQHPFSSPNPLEILRDFQAAKPDPTPGNGALHKNLRVMGESPGQHHGMDAPVQLQLLCTTSLRNKHRDSPRDSHEPTETETGQKQLLLCFTKPPCSSATSSREMAVPPCSTDPTFQQQPV